MRHQLVRYDADARIWVPANIAVCHECGNLLFLWVHGWETQTGKPILPDLQVECINDDDEDDDRRHRWHQSEWDGPLQRIQKWAEHAIRIVEDITR